MKIGALGGTFDPVHNGHITIAEEVRIRLGLDLVYFIPAAQTPLKEECLILDAEYRVEMIRLAIAEYPYFELSMIEIERPGPSYTADTLEELRGKLGSGGEIFFIIGWDSLAQLPQWKEPTRIIKAGKLVAVSRPGYTLPDMNALESEIPGLTQKLKILDTPGIDISATEIRRRIVQGVSINQLVPEPVEEYIKKNRLYLS